MKQWHEDHILSRFEQASFPGRMAIYAGYYFAEEDQ